MSNAYDSDFDDGPTKSSEATNLFAGLESLRSPRRHRVRPQEERVSEEKPYSPIVLPQNEPADPTAKKRIPPVRASSSPPLVEHQSSAETPPVGVCAENVGETATVRPVPDDATQLLLPNYKLLMLGDAAVGKTNLLSRFTDNRFDAQTKATIGVEFATRMVDLSCGQGGTNRVVMQIWDTAGQDHCFALAKVYYRHARGCVVVYDVTRRETLRNVAGWISHAKQHCDPDCEFVVVGNKTDLANAAEVQDQEAVEFCHALGVRHFLASAMNGEGVMTAFLQLLLAVHALSESKGCANKATNAIGAGISENVVLTSGKRKKCCQ